MIQRTQTIYLLLTIITLLILLLGTDVFTSVVQKKGQFELINHGNVYGVQSDLTIYDKLSDDTETALKNKIGATELTSQMKKIPTFYFPFFSYVIVLTVLAFAVLFSYKNLKKQLKLGRLLFVLNFFLFIGAIFCYYFLIDFSYIAKPYEAEGQLKIGFVCICIAFALSFMANIGIRRDLRLIQSINRIR